MGTRGVVVGRVIKVRPHPNGDRIWLADVDIGHNYNPQIVWGGRPIVEPGCLVAVAPPGSWLPTGKTRRRRYRGEPSDGMLCSLAELGWSPLVQDEVALLDPSSGLQPGDSLDDRPDVWQAIVLPAPPRDTETDGSAAPQLDVRLPSQRVGSAKAEPRSKTSVRRLWSAGRQLLTNRTGRAVR